MVTWLAQDVWLAVQTARVLPLLGSTKEGMTRATTMLNGLHALTDAARWQLASGAKHAGRVCHNRPAARRSGRLLPFSFLFAVLALGSRCSHFVLALDAGANDPKLRALQLFSQSIQVQSFEQGLMTNLGVRQANGGKGGQQWKTVLRVPFSPAPTP